MVAKKRFLLAAADGGSAQYLLPVGVALYGRCHTVTLTAPEDHGVAHRVFKTSPLKEMFIPREEYDPTHYDAVFLGMDVNVSAFGHAVYERATRVHVPVMFTGDNYFNHAFPAWRDVTNGYWCAIDEGHADAIRQMRDTSRESLNIRVVGLPLFDTLTKLIPEQDAMRKTFRTQYGIGDTEAVIVWWSHSIRELYTEDKKFVLEALRRFVHESGTRVAFFPMLHPALDQNVHTGFSEEEQGAIEKFFSNYPVRIIDARQRGTTAETLNTAANVVFAGSLSIEGLKAVLLGTPVIRTFGESGLAHFTKTLGQFFPFWGDTTEGMSYATRSVDETYFAFCIALHTGKYRAKQSSKESSIDTICNYLEEIAD